MAQQTKPPTLPPISSGPQGQQDIARFEAHMKTYGVNKSTWSTELRSLLRGDLTNLAMSMPTEELGDYDALKRQLYAHMGVSKSTQFNNWFNPKINPTETITEMGYRTAEAARTCTKDCTSVKEVIDHYQGNRLQTIEPENNHSCEGSETLILAGFVEHR